MLNNKLLLRSFVFCYWDGLPKHPFQSKLNLSPSASPPLPRLLTNAVKWRALGADVCRCRGLDALRCCLRPAGTLFRLLSAFPIRGFRNGVCCCPEADVLRVRARQQRSWSDMCLATSQSSADAPGKILGSLLSAWVTVCKAFDNNDQETKICELPQCRLPLRLPSPLNIPTEQINADSFAACTVWA
jgi:hypothetical protein